MTFQIFALLPTYDDRDGVTGEKAYLQANTYETAACARKIADRLAREDAADGESEAHYVVVPTGSSPFDTKAQVWAPRADIGFDDLPF